VVKHIFRVVAKDDCANIEAPKETSTSRFIQANLNYVIITVSQFVHFNEKVNLSTNFTFYILTTYNKGMLLYIWLSIFVFGLLLYFLPVFIFERRYEGFEDVQSDPAAYIQQLKTIFEPATTGTPDFQFSIPTASPTLPPQPETQRSGAKPVPDGATTQSSRPSVPNPPATKTTDSIQQGAAFQQTLPLPPMVKPNHVPAKTDVVPRLDDAEEEVETEPKPIRKQKPRTVIKYVEVPAKCPPPPPQPKCPDMRDYIRKDSIPCWACKLK
jgi:hypothetical protein